MSAEPLPALLARRGDDVLRFARRRAGRLLRYETEEDLAQGIRAQALERGRDFEFRTEKEFLSWLYSVARSYLADRHAYWTALKRRPARLLRLTWAGSDTSDAAAVPEPPGTRTGPSTFASRREQLALAVKALALLLPRDRDLVTWDAEGHSVAELAQRLAISHEAAERARRRALERFRKAYRLVAGAVT